jgi:hypothetical protein
MATGSPCVPKKARNSSKPGFGRMPLAAAAARQSSGDRARNWRAERPIRTARPVPAHSLPLDGPRVLRTTIVTRIAEFG